MSVDAMARTPDAFGRALACYQEGKLVEAAALCEQTLEPQPQHFEALHLLGIINLISGRPERAVELFAIALQLEPRSVAAHGNHGNSLYELKRYESAIVCYENAIALCPQLPEAYNNRGNALRALQRRDAAIVSYDAAIALKPDYADAYRNRGLTLYELKSYEAAIDSYGRAAALQPDSAEIYHGRGNALRELKRYQAALASYDKAISLAQHADFYNDRGLALAVLRRHDEALASYDRAIALDPGSPESYANRAAVLRDLMQHEAAIESYDKAATLQPQLKFLAGARLYTRMQIAAWDQVDAQFAQLEAAIRQGEPVANPLCVVTLSGSTALQHQAAEIWVRYTSPPSSILPAIDSRDRCGKIRIGYFSADFRSHPVAMLMAPVFEAHDRTRFEVSGFSFGPDSGDPLRPRLVRAFDRFIDVRDRSDLEISQLARELEIDIAVDLGGFTAGARPGIFALRAAPIQVNYLGYPGTLSAPYIDYIIADEVVIPRAARPCYSEKVAYLPHCCLPGGDRPAIAASVQRRADCGLPPDGFVFCCFNGHHKITPGTFDSWMRVLHAIEGSVLWLKAGGAAAVRNLRQEAARRGVAPERIVFAEPLHELEDHLARHRLADLFLDTLPYNAHTTAADALWAGLPVLTCAGEAFAARVGASLLRAVGLPELITTTRAHYEALAVELARDTQRLAGIRQRLAAQRTTLPLFNVALFTGGLESTYIQMYQRHQTGSPPEHIHVESRH